MKYTFKHENGKTVYSFPLPESDLNQKYIEEAFSNNYQEKEEVEETPNKYQLLHPEIFDLGRIKGEDSYEKSYSREQTFNYLFKYNNYKDSELSAFLEGAMVGFDDSEKEDYLTNLNEE